jgi:hypothetical protein
LPIKIRVFETIVKRMGAYNLLNDDASCSYRCEHMMYHLRALQWLVRVNGNFICRSRNDEACNRESAPYIARESGPLPHCKGTLPVQN